MLHVIRRGRVFFLQGRSNVIVIFCFKIVPQTRYNKRWRKKIGGQITFLINYMLLLLMLLMLFFFWNVLGTPQMLVAQFRHYRETLITSRGLRYRN